MAAKLNQFDGFAAIIEILSKKQEPAETGRCGQRCALAA
jgi:hypothetical protein